MLPVVPRVFVLGNSNITKFLTYKLATHPSQPTVPDVVLILKSEEESKSFVDFHKSSITVRNFSIRYPAVYKTQVMATAGAPRYSNGAAFKLSNVVLGGSDSHRADELLSAFQRSIGPRTNILLLDSSRSVVERIQNHIFKDPAKRPTIYQCISSHRLFGKYPFEVGTLATGNLTICKVPKDIRSPDKEEMNLSLDAHLDKQPDFIKMLVDTTGIHPVFVSFRDFEILQLESLVIRAATEPLSVIYDCSYGELLQMENITNLVTQIVKESVTIIKKALPHTLENPYLETALDVNRLVTVVFNILRVNFNDMSNLKFHLRNNREKLHQNTSEYFVELAKKGGIESPVNTLYAEQVEARHSMAMYKSNSGFKRWKPKIRKNTII